MSKAPSYQVVKQKKSTWHAHSNQPLKPIKREAHSGFHPFSNEVIHIPPLHMSTAYHTVFIVNYLWIYATGQSQCEGVNSPPKRVPAMHSVSQDSMLCRILNMRWHILPKIGGCALKPKNNRKQKLKRIQYMCAESTTLQYQAWKRGIYLECLSSLLPKLTLKDLCVWYHLLSVRLPPWFPRVLGLSASLICNHPFILSTIKKPFTDCVVWARHCVRCKTYTKDD